MRWSRILTPEIATEMVQEYFDEDEVIVMGTKGKKYRWLRELPPGVSTERALTDTEVASLRSAARASGFKVSIQRIGDKIPYPPMYTITRGAFVDDPLDKELLGITFGDSRDVFPSVLSEVRRSVYRLRSCARALFRITALGYPAHKYRLTRLSPLVPTSSISKRVDSKHPLAQAPIGTQVIAPDLVGLKQDFIRGCYRWLNGRWGEEAYFDVKKQEDGTYLLTKVEG